MIVAFLALLGVISILMGIGIAVVRAVQLIGDRRDERREALAAAERAAGQAAWEQHVADAVRLTEEPLYNTIAARYASDIDAEWAQLAGGDWSTS